MPKSRLRPGFSSLTPGKARRLAKSKPQALQPFAGVHGNCRVANWQEFFYIRAHHDLRLTQLLLGHADIRSTARYAQLDTADLADALRDMRGGAD